MLIMHLDEHKTSPSSTTFPALTKCKDTRSLLWQMETPTYPSQLTLTPSLEEARSQNSSSSKQIFICTKIHCGKQFPRSFALRRHMRIHTGMKPYECDYEGCLQRFNTSGNLSRHKRIHSGERPYPCIFASCGKRFNTSTKLKRHMRLHFPDGHKLFRCLDRVDCNWSGDNYKEFAQHRKLHHNSFVDAQQQPQSYARQEPHRLVNASEEKDSESLSTREYSTAPHSFGTHHSAAATGSFLYPTSFDKPKSSVLPGRTKRTMPSAAFGSSDLGSLSAVLSKDYGSDQRRMRSNGHAFPFVQYSSTGGSFLSSSECVFNRLSFASANPFAPHQRQDERDDCSYEQQQSQQHQMLPPPGHHVLRPPPQSSQDTKYGGFVSPPVGPEFTGEELSVVLQLMNETGS